MSLARLSTIFQSLPPLPTSKLGPSGAASLLMYIIGPCGSFQLTLLWGWEFLLPPQPPQIFTVWGFEALFPHAGTLGCVACLIPQLFLPVYPHANVGLPTLVLQPVPCHESSPPQLPISAPHTGLDECFFFNSVVVGLPYSLIIWQFRLFFVFKFVVVLLLVVQGAT